MPKPRERAAALLKIADGMRPTEVARVGFLLPRDPNTVYDWLNCWLAEGIDGLSIRDDRGRKPAFSPSARRRQRPVCCIRTK
jgi:transposase